MAHTSLFNGRLIRLSPLNVVRSGWV